MDRKRSSTPSPREDAYHQSFTPHPTPGATLPKTVIPPSPGSPRRAALFAGSKLPEKLRPPPPGSKRSQSACVQKPTHKAAKTKTSFFKIIETISDGKKPAGLMDLPGEIRNMIYCHTSNDSRQALLAHRPRIASLRPRTQLDRHRTLESDIIDKEQGLALATSNTRARGLTTVHARKRKTALLPRETNRPFVGLTQVCRLLRQEFRPLYMQRQEIGMDIVEVESYLKTFYPEAVDQLKVLSTSNDRNIDMHFTGNMTIAVGDKLKQVEKSAEGIDVLPLLDVWANSYKIEAGFGRYMQHHYDATADGEAKDLYRLFGRRVQKDRKCSPMNAHWRAILRTRALASVRIHRHPAGWSQHLPRPMQTASILTNHSVATRPYIHVLFAPHRAEAWMTEFKSQIPPGWLADLGFGTMEYFEVNVGIALATGK